jgi:hypothetical protein
MNGHEVIYTTRSPCRANQMQEKPVIGVLQAVVNADRDQCSNLILRLRDDADKAGLRSAE